MRLSGEGALGGEAVSLLVADEEVLDCVVWGGSLCSGVMVRAVEGVGGAEETGAVSCGRLGSASARGAASTVVGRGTMVGGEEVSGARGVAVSSAREVRTWDMAAVAVSTASEATSEVGGVAEGAVGVSTAGVATSEVWMVVVSEEVVAGALGAAALVKSGG